MPNRWYKELQYLKVESSDETIWKFGTIGDTFYIILNGETSVFIPNQTIVNLNILEYYKLINDYKDMVLEVNGNDNIELPKISKRLIELSNSIDLDKVIEKLGQSNNKPGVTNSIKSSDLNRSQSLTSMKNDALVGSVSTEEK